MIPFYKTPSSNKNLQAIVIHDLDSDECRPHIYN